MKSNLRWILLAAALLVFAAVVYFNATGPDRNAARYALTPNLGSGQQESHLKPSARLPRLLQLRAGAD